MNDSEGIRKIRRYFADRQRIINDLDVFLEKKNEYIKEPTVENRIALKMAYVDIYEDIKVECYSFHNYSEQTFWEYVDYLKEGL